MVTMSYMIHRPSTGVWSLYCNKREFILNAIINIPTRTADVQAHVGGLRKEGNTYTYSWFVVEHVMWCGGVLCDTQYVFCSLQLFIDTLVS